MRCSWASEQLRFFFEPLQLHLQAAYLLEQLCLFGLAFFLVLALAAPCEQLTGTIQQLPLPLTDLDGVDGVISGDLLDRLAATDRFHGDSGLELGAMGAAFAHMAGAPVRGGTPPQKLTMGPVQKKQTTSSMRGCICVPTATAGIEKSAGPASCGGTAM